MKKLITLLLVLTGYVMTATAQKFYFGLEIAGISSSSVKVYRYGATGADSWSSPAAATDEGLKFGRHWYSVDLNGQPNAIVRVGANDDDSSDDIEGINTSKYYYVSSDKTGGSSNSRYNVGTVDNPFVWQHMRFLSNITGYSETDDNTDNPSDNKFTYELSKATIGENSYVYFRFRQGDFVPLKDDGSSLRNYAHIHPQSNNAVIDIPGSSTSYYQAASTDWVWKVSVPSYDYEKIVFTAQYVNESGYKWKISADAYISKTVYKANKYATLGCDGAALDLSGLAAKNITAYPLTVTAVGKIAKGDAITGVLAANKGVLLETSAADDVTLSIPVSAETGSDGSTNLVATTGTSVRIDTETGYTNYILASQNSHIGFYMVNATYGNTMGANTAYLHVANSYVPTTSLARGFWFDDDDTTGIAAVEKTDNTESAEQKVVYNLNGQRVMNPTKGLYIVNGKKVIMK